MFKRLLALLPRPVLLGREPERCGSCRYFRADAPQLVTSADAPGAGTCRRELPRVITFPAQATVIRGQQQQAAVNLQSYWPPTSAPEWCGKYRRRRA